MPGAATAQRDRLTGSGAYRHRVTVQVPTMAGADGDGGYTETWTEAIPATWAVSIGAAPRADEEAARAGTTIAQATYVVRGRYRADVTSRARVVFAGRLLNVITVRNLDERRRVLEVICTEVVA